MMNDVYRSRCFVVISHVVCMRGSPTVHKVYLYEYETRRFKEPFLSSQTKNTFIGEARVFQMIQESGALTSGDCDGNSLLLDAKNSECNEYIFISGYEIVRFTTEEKIIDFIFKLA